MARCLTVAAGNPDTLKIEEVVVEGQQLPGVYPDMARVVHSFTRQTIERLPGASLQDILEYVSALDIRQRGSDGVQADVSMRGGSFEQVLILLNGVRINDPQTGHHNLNIPVNVNDIERIEILKGPGSRIHGPNAFSGAINIITREQGSGSISAAIKAGEYGYYDLHASGSFNLGTIENYISFGKGSSDGFTSNTDYDKTNLFIKTRGTTGIGIIGLQAGYLEKGFGANNFYSSLYPDQYEKIKASFTHVSWQAGGRLKHRHSVYHRRHRDRFELFRYESEPWYDGHNYHMTDVYGVNSILTVPWSSGTFYLGTEARAESILSSLLGEPLDSPLAVKNEKGAFYNYHKKRNQLNLTTGTSMTAGRFSVSAGALLTATEGAGWGLYGGLDVGAEIGRNVVWFSSWNRSLRIPSFTEMYYTSPVHRGNPGLTHEESTTLETGLKINRNNWRWHLAMFKRNGFNIIDWVKEEEALIWESRNITNLNTLGTEISIAWQRPANLRVPVRELRAGYTFLDITRQSEYYISAYVLDYLRHKLVAGITIPIHKKADITLMTTYQARAGTFTSFTTNSEVSYDPFILVDALLNISITEAVRISADISNLLNTGYVDIGNVPVPGRWIRAGIYLFM